MHTHIKDISAYVSKEVTLKGWLHNKRSSGKIAFLEIRDGSGFLQIIVNKSDVDEATWGTVEALTQESSFSVIGEVSSHPKKEGVFELQARTVHAIHIATEYPIGNKDHGPDFLMNHRHLWVRSKKQWATLRIRDVIETAIHDYLHSEAFVRTDSPIFTPSACEDTTELFPVPYFDLGEAYLSQSGQLYLEAVIAGLGRCYDFGPVFRAEKSVTRRHLTEFWMMDAEAAFVEHDENMDTQEGLVKAIVKMCLERCQVEFSILERDTSALQGLLEKPFERLMYKDAITRLQSLGSDIKFGEDLGNDDEGLLTKESPVPVFIHKWPKDIKPFYMKRDAEDETLVCNNDLIGIEGAGEIIGGSQREDDYDVLMARIKEDGLEIEDYAWYSELRKYGSVPHSGFGLGLERMVRWIAGSAHIRETIPFPRLVNRIRP
ncbi:MAG: asparagine--tRNA ligase [Candidatus Magasanikbacteria bacterium]|jgi:asparaginyl-tRNA synthetase|nr:asparagine--tRNA ligase [Candidatus Magasanikbacteria bacterium]MBT4220810.1 asparagine--tRNA ligase [Candidatus Magasanikbacteria bacterium]MBT4350155.1 asparagine--tRNA ligase [Candidatus Magasanikbacteria bacterium]MBT4541402.1 asparagine--tRNA ligase [Candidatus Magasanikbacteria bacterium]MBT6253158.1 asparagine--tRNA ligase [Candidatus Magasanikbacteria bacterium]